ncbi:MAG TPA: Ger(x)C family spore germination protein [Firmicutes bacterium]|nr:Ger(x)C family spore germination protein [Bacillota bacterium]
MTARRICAVILIIFLLLLIPGCWDQREIEQLAIVRAIAVDYLPGRKAPYLVTMVVLRPADLAGGESGGGSGGGSQPLQLFSGVGASIDLAITQTTTALSRRVYLSHAELVLVGEELARTGITPVLDFIIRYPEIRNSVYLMFVPGRAQQVLPVPERLEEAVVSEMLGLLKNAEQIPFSDPQRAFEFLRDLLRHGQEPFLAVMQAPPPLEATLPELQQVKESAGGRQNGGQGEGGGQGTSPGGGQQEEEKVLTVAGTAAFKNDKLAGIMDARETRGYLWFTGNVRNAVIAVHDPGQPEAVISMLVTRAQTKITPVVKGDKVSFRVEVDTEGDISSQNTTTNLNTPEILRKLNSAIAGAVKVEMEQALQKMQSLETDLVGFGAILGRKEPKLFGKLHKKWPRFFRTLEVDITVKANIRRTGQQGNVPAGYH